MIKKNGYLQIDVLLFFVWMIQNKIERDKPYLYIAFLTFVLLSV